MWLQAGGGVCGSAESDEKFGAGSSLQIGGMRCWTVCKGVVGSMRERRAAVCWNRVDGRGKATGRGGYVYCGCSSPD